MKDFYFCEVSRMVFLTITESTVSAGFGFRMGWMCKERDDYIQTAGSEYRLNAYYCEVLLLCTTSCFYLYCFRLLLFHDATVWETQFLEHSPKTCYTRLSSKCTCVLDCISNHGYPSFLSLGGHILALMGFLMLPLTFRRNRTPFNRTNVMMVYLNGCCFDDVRLRKFK